MRRALALLVAGCIPASFTWQEWHGYPGAPFSDVQTRPAGAPGQDVVRQVDACLATVQWPSCPSTPYAGPIAVSIGPSERSCDGTQEVLQVRAPSAGCVAKGLTPTDTCPCRWRAGLRYPNEVITTPDLYMVPDPIVRLRTGCANPWESALARCAAPVTQHFADVQ